jgi:hypothetical protein
VTALTLVGGYYGFKSKIDVSCGNPIDRSNPYSTPFTLSNEGVLAVYNVYWTVDLISVDFGLPNIQIDDNRFGKNEKISPLNPGQKTTMFLSGSYSKVGSDYGDLAKVEGVPIRKMDVICSVSYQNILGLVEKQDFRFVCIPSEGGNYQWIAWSVSNYLSEALAALSFRRWRR